jgi:hypothetical protein
MTTPKALLPNLWIVSGKAFEELLKKGVDYQFAEILAIALERAIEEDYDNFKLSCGGKAWVRLNEITDIEALS